MTMTDRIYGKILLDNGITQDIADETRSIFSACPELSKALTNPIIKHSEKYAVIKKLFPQEIYAFLCVACDNGVINRINYILDEYTEQRLSKNDCIKATVRYVTELTPEQQEGLKKLIIKKYGWSDVVLELKYSPELIGGFILDVGDFQYDKSYRTSIRNMYNNLKGR